MLQFNWSLVCQIINLAVFCWLIKKFLVKPVTDIMAQRKSMIEQGFVEIKTKEEQAEELKKHYEEVLKNTESERHTLLENARERAEQESERIVSAAKAQADETKKKAQQEIEAQKDRTKEEAKKYIADLAVQVSKKISEKDVDCKTDHFCYDQWLQELEEEQHADRT